jgi:hypothetical protein
LHADGESGAMNMDDEPERPGWPGTTARRARQLATGIIYARLRGADEGELGALCGRAVAELAAAGAGEHAEACLFQSVITVGADVLLVAATAVDQPPDQMVAKLQETCRHMEADD